MKNSQESAPTAKGSLPTDAFGAVRHAVLEALATSDGRQPHRHYRLAVSGGLDSMVLLDVMARLQPMLAGSRLTCHYVNHRLHPEAAVWGEQVASAAAALHVPSAELSAGAIDPAAGGLEAAARTARYAALAAVMDDDDVLLTAHHQDDQAETVLLQALRGAGIAGLRAMPCSAPFGPGTRARPLLNLPRSTLVAYARKRGVAWVEDSSNSDVRHDRNYLRHEVLPLLRTRWPAVSATLAQLAATCADEQQVLDSAALGDLESANAGVAGGTGNAQSLSAAAVRGLPPAYARNAIRWWLRQQGFSAPPRARLEALLANVVSARPDATPCVQWGGCEVRRYRDRLYAMAPLAPAPSGALPFPAGPALTLPDNSVLSVERQHGLGIAEHWLTSHEVQIGWRRGGERLVLPGRAHSSPLKKLLQQWGVLPWMRDRLPLVLVDGQVAGVADLAVAGPFAAADNAPGLAICWRRSAAVCALQAPT